MSIEDVLAGRRSWEVAEGDCIDVLAKLPDASVDAIVTDPPYGLEFMGKDWDRFRVDDPGTTRNRGERAGSHGELGQGNGTNPARHGVAAVGFGGGKRPTTSRCTSCGKRDQRRNPHACENPRWALEIIDPYAAPPTMLAFGEWCRVWALEAYRILKPGAHVLAFGGTRTYHRLAAGLEDAGFEIRDSLMWVYGSGFPKSMDLQKAVAKSGDDGDAERWTGWGTALKPAHEPIVLARKPVAGTVAANVLEHGTGGLNVDGCLVAASGRPLVEKRIGEPEVPEALYGAGLSPGSRQAGTTDEGRWPPNFLLGHGACCAENECGPCCPARELDAQSIGGGMHSAGAARAGSTSPRPTAPSHWQGPAVTDTGKMHRFGDDGGAARFFPRFRYVPKASTRERNDGLSEEFERLHGLSGGAQGAIERGEEDYNLAVFNRVIRVRNHHPTVKPIELMRWLVRLVTPPGGVVLDPFAGSGSTLLAASREGVRCIGVEREPEYAAIARRRFEEDAPLFNRLGEPDDATP